MADPAKAWAWITVPLRALGAIIRSMLTGPDNQSWAPGRVMGLAVFVVGQCLVIRATHDVLARHPAVADWVVFFGGVGPFEAGICATAIGLVLGMAPTDSGGRWWGKEASPPPPPNR